VHWCRHRCRTGFVVVGMSTVVGGKRGKASVPSTTINKMVGLYNPIELRPFEGRAGAMDAFKLPSLIGDQRVLRKDAGDLK
jgi:hypothetical protein